MACREVPSPAESFALVRDSTRETADRFRTDFLLRQYGFVIESRPDGATPTWRRLSDGKVFLEGDAKMVVLAQRAKDLKRLTGKA